MAGKLLGIFAALAAAELAGFGLAGAVVFAGAGDEGVGGYAVIVLAGVLLTAASLSVAALLAATAVGRRRVRALAGAVVVWLAAAVLLDLVALGLASLLPSGPASRVLILSVIVNPVAAVRTGALLAVEGTAAFGAASLALLRFTGGPLGAALLLGGSVASWIALPAALAARRLARIDL
jgi:Cu-processing system permease protein